MSKRSQEKRKARSKEKKHARRRLMGSSPLSRLAGTAEETCECWVSASPDNRMVSLQVLRPVRGGQTVVACFLIDFDCIGLKDAFYRLNVDAFEMRESLRRRSLDDGLRSVRVELPLVREMVAGAMRWTREHPFFRMPPDAERCLKIIGGAGDVDAADIRDFGKDGKLLYVGRAIDLQPRLVGMTVEEFLERPDVEVVFHLGDASFEDIDDEDDEWEPPFVEEEYDADVASVDLDATQVEEDMLAMRRKVKDKMMDAIRKWCFANAVMPHPALEAAVDLSVAASLEGLNEEDEQTATVRSLDAQATLASFETEEQQKALAEAMQQLEKFAASFASQEEYMAAVGMDDIGSD